MNSRIQFWRYSSRTRKGHQFHPLTRERREAVVVRWNAGESLDDIAFAVDIDIVTVKRHLRMARKANDPRAARRVRRKELVAS